MRLTRLLGCLGFFIALAGLVALLAWGVLRFSTPRPTLVLVGQVQDYPPSQAPRLLDDDNTPFYVLNMDGDLQALYARTSHHTQCLVRWDEQSSLFVDPCLGTRFFPSGEYQGGGPPQELVQLPLQVNDGQVWVEINRRK